MQRRAGKLAGRVGLGKSGPTAGRIKMWIGSVSPAKKHKADGEVKDEGKSVHQMLHSLDGRLRAQEGLLATYFLAENDSILVPAMIQGNAYYDGKKTGQRTAARTRAQTNYIGGSLFETSFGSGHHQSGHGPTCVL